MKTMIKRWTAATAVMATLLVASCDRVGQITEPLRPGAESLAKGGSKGELKLIPLVESLEARATYRHAAVIGREGGSVGDDAYRIDVPRNAVEGPTLFVITAASGEYANNIALEASATACGSLTLSQCEQATPTNDVGAAGFRVPVLIAFGFNPGGGRKQWNGVRVVLVDPLTDTYTAVPTNVNMARKEVRGHADHFSLYALGWP